MKARFWRLAVNIVVLPLFLVTPVWAQSGEQQLLLSLNKSVGYNDFEGNIQGAFTLSVNEISGLVRVVFLIDGTEMGQITASPFKLKFETADYLPGVHTLSAIGHLNDGSEIHSNEIRTRFLNAQEGRQKTLNIILPIVGVVFGILLLSFAIPMVVGGRKSRHQHAEKPGSYGLLGGGICPKCKRPFGMHLWGINLLVGKLERCPYCGKWSVVRRATQQELAAAEVTMLEKAHPESDNQSQKTNQMLHDLDESRYTDA